MTFISCGFLIAIQEAAKRNISFTLEPSMYAAYTIATDKIKQMVPYSASIVAVALVFSGCTFLFVVVAAMTLHSRSKVNLHCNALILAFVCALLTVVTKTYYHSLVVQAVANLPNAVSPSTNSDYVQVAEQMESAYGFWGTPTTLLVGIISVLCIASLGAAAVTSKPLPTSTREEPTLSIREEPILSTHEAPILATHETPIPYNEPNQAPTTRDTTVDKMKKYCRFCGAQILRDSVFCEECGKKII